MRARGYGTTQTHDRTVTELIFSSLSLIKDSILPDPRHMLTYLSSAPLGHGCLFPDAEVSILPHAGLICWSERRRRSSKVCVRPRTMRVVSTSLRGAEPTTLGDGAQLDRDNATYLLFEPIRCQSRQITYCCLHPFRCGYNVFQDESATFPLLEILEEKKWLIQIYISAGSMRPFSSFSFYK